MDKLNRDVVWCPFSSSHSKPYMVCLTTTWFWAVAWFWIKFPDCLHFAHTALVSGWMQCTQTRLLLGKLFLRHNPAVGGGVRIWWLRCGNGHTNTTSLGRYLNIHAVPLETTRTPVTPRKLVMLWEEWGTIYSPTNHLSGLLQGLWDGAPQHPSL